jgi:hypothetical protein
MATSDTYYQARPCHEYTSPWGHISVSIGDYANRSWDFMTCSLDAGNEQRVHNPAIPSDQVVNFHDLPMERHPPEARILPRYAFDERVWANGAAKAELRPSRREDHSMQNRRHTPVDRRTDTHLRSLPRQQTRLPTRWSVSPMTLPTFVLCGMSPLINSLRALSSQDIRYLLGLGLDLALVATKSSKLTFPI